jgi:hypothetical protein
MLPAAIAHPTQVGKKVLARPTTSLSLRLTVPVSPSTHSNAPCQASNPASVTTNDGTWKRVNHVP